MIVSCLVIPLKLGIPDKTTWEISHKDLKCLADNVYFEARGESERGQILVAKTALNRAKASNSSVCTAVYAPRQFSWTNKPHSIKDAEAWGSAARAAALAHLDNTPVMFYHSVKVKPYWSKHKVVIARVGNHIFYR